MSLRKKFRGGSSVQEGQALKGSRITASEQTQHRCYVVTAVAPEAADAETALIEVTDEDVATARVEIHATNVDVLEQTLSGGEEVADHGVNHDPSGGRLLVFRQEGLLLVPRLRRRVGDRCLADQLPADLAFVLGERLLVVPVLVVEQGLGRLLGDATNIEKRERERCDENVRVLGGDERLFGERHFGEIRELLLRGVHPEVLDRFLDTEVVLAHDLAGELLARRRLVAAVDHQPCDVRDERGISVDASRDFIGVVADRNPQALIGGIDVAGGDLCPCFHGIAPLLAFLKLSRRRLDLSIRSQNYVLPQFETSFLGPDLRLKKLVSRVIL